MNMLFINVLTVICLFNFQYILTKPPQFYDFKQDHIEEYDTEDFKKNVLNSNKATLVEFYAHWCGSSKKFRSKMRAIANETQTWEKNVLRVVAVDCYRNASGDHEICDENGVIEYPVFKLYHARATKVIGFLMKSDEHSKLETFMKEAIDFIEQQRHRPREWPNLYPYMYAILQVTFFLI